MTFPLHLLPASIRVAINAQSAIGDYPVEAVAPAALAIVAFATQAIADVELLHIPNGSGPISQFYMVLARSGDAKSSVFDGLMTGPRRWQKRKLAEYQDQMITYDAEKRVWEGEFKKAERAGDTERLIGLRRDQPAHPMDPRNTLTKTTTNGVYRTFETSWPSLGLLTPEGGSLLAGHSLRSDNAPAEFASMMTLLWDGAPIDRTTGEITMRMDGRRISSLVMVQPEVAADFLTNHVLRRQGLHARFLIAAPPPYIPPKAKFLDVASEALAARHVEGLAPFANQIEALLDHPMRHAPNDIRTLQPRTIRWDADARGHIGNWFNTVARQWRIDDPDPFFSRGMEHAHRIAASLFVFDRFSELRGSGLSSSTSFDEKLECVGDRAHLAGGAIGLDHAKAATAIVEWFVDQRRALDIPVGHERDTREADYVEKVVKFMRSTTEPVRMRDLSRGPLQRLDRAVRERIVDAMLKDSVIAATEVTGSAGQKSIEYHLTA